MLEQNAPDSVSPPTLTIQPDSTGESVTPPYYSSDSMQYPLTEVPQQPQSQVTSSSRGVGDLLESIRGGTKTLKKVEPETQQVTVRDL